MHAALQRAGASEPAFLNQATAAVPRLYVAKCCTYTALSVAIIVMWMPSRPLTNFQNESDSHCTHSGSYFYYISSSLFSTVSLGKGDNFAKFLVIVLDSMNCVMFANDRQAIIIKVVKTVDDCNICTIVGQT